jgi:hypothetical protein
MIAFPLSRSSYLLLFFGKNPVCYRGATPCSKVLRNAFEYVPLWLKLALTLPLTPTLAALGSSSDSDT